MAASRAMAQTVREGCVVEFMQANRPILAWVLEEQGGKLRLLSQGQREMKLGANRVLPWTGPCYEAGASRQEIQDTLLRHAAKRDGLAAEVDPYEMWELAQGEVEAADPLWFAELIWETPDADQLAAVGRALLGAKTHFKFSPPEFQVYTEDKVEQRLAELQAAEERERLAATGNEFFRRLWDIRRAGGSGDIPVLSPEAATGLEKLLRTRIGAPEDRDTQQLWDIVRKGLPEDPNLPLLLAKTWGLVPEHHNFLMEQADYVPGDAWAAPFAAEIDALRARVGATLETVEELDLVSIDAATTRDRDDAFCIRREGEGETAGFQVTLALAGPACCWDFGSPLDAAVRNRATSVYLPEGDSHMMPEALGTDYFSLEEGTERPALVVDVTMDHEAEITATELRFSWVRVRANLSYEGVEGCLCGDAACDEDMLAAGLDMADDLADRLRRKRIERGAVVIEREEPEIRLSGDVAGLGPDIRVDLEPKPETPAAQRLVAEMMILANEAVALWALEREVPLLHRTQDVTVSRESAGVWSLPEDVHAVVKGLAASILETRAKPHASLGAKAYSPVTSPMRRYPDFLNLAQVLSVLETGSPRWSLEEFTAMLPYVSARLDAVSRIQRFRPRYWKLLYFKQQDPQRRYRSVVVDEGPRYVVAALPREQLFVRGRRDIFGDKILPGQRYEVRLGKIDPLANEIHVLEAWEL